MKLLIVESPAKARTIGKYIGSEYEVLASIGHVRDLPKSNKQAIDIPAGFVPYYEISKGKDKVVAEIKREAKKASQILLATDPDREGEAIAWHIADELRKAKISSDKIKRVTYHEITKEAILEALKHPREIDDNLRRAQEARRVLDRLVGYDLSGLIWKKVRYGLSAGRVQSPALRIIMEREREIRAFVPEQYFDLFATLQKSGSRSSDQFIAHCSEEPKTLTNAEKIYESAKTGKWHVVFVTETEVKRSPRPPFTTSTLQQTASTRLGYSPKKTMIVAQKLYEGGHITYMRTDSVNMATSAISEIERVVAEKFDKGMFAHKSYKSKSKNAQEAHEAIRPTHFSEDKGSNDDERALYRLIFERALSSQMIDAQTLRTTIKSNITGGSIPDFVAVGTRIISPGWLLADPRSRGEDTILPELKKHDSLDLIDLVNDEKFTEPPNRYSEAGLIKELEKRDIGRPSTYASTISTLLDREYVIKEGKTLRPTDTGDVVSTFLEENFAQYISDSFTAEMENELDEIADGKRQYRETLEQFYGPFQSEVKEKSTSAKITTMGLADERILCPECGKAMAYKLGKNGKFLSCINFPECLGMRSVDGTLVAPEESIGIDPVSGLEVFVLTGKYGPYVQLGKLPEKVKGKKSVKPRRASIPKDKNPQEVTLALAMHYLSLPRELGAHADGEKIIANIGMYGPYIGHGRDFRSLKTDDVYSITLERALEILSEPKRTRGRWKKTNS